MPRSTNLVEPDAPDAPASNASAFAGKPLTSDLEHKCPRKHRSCSLVIVAVAAAAAAAAPAAAAAAAACPRSRGDLASIPSAW